MLTGQRAFAGDADRSAAAQILSRSETGQRAARLVPAALADVVSRCLRKILHVATNTSQTSRSRSRTYGGTASGSQARRPAIDRGGDGRRCWCCCRRRSRPGTSRGPNGLDLKAHPNAGTSDDASRAGSLATLAPDGEQVAFAWSGPNQDNDDIYVQRIGSGTEVRRTMHPARNSVRPGPPTAGGSHFSAGRCLADAS